MDKLESTSEQPQPEVQQVEVKTEPVKESKKNSSRKWWIAIFLLVVVILFAVTTPDKYDHREAINSEVSSAVTSTLVGKVGSWAVLGNIVVSKIVDLTIDSNLKVDNYLVFSLAKAELDGKNRVLSVGLLNHVWVLFDKKDLEQLLTTQADTLWQNFVNNSFLNSLGIGAQNSDERALPSAPTEQQALPADSVAAEKKPGDVIDEAIQDVSSELEQALQRGVSKAVQDVLKGILGGQ